MTSFKSKSKCNRVREPIKANDTVPLQTAAMTLTLDKAQGSLNNLIAKLSA